MAEKAILKFCKWDFNINPPSDLIDTIYNNLTMKFINNGKSIEIINKYKDISITFLQYAICELYIYSKYNQIIMAFSSCYITINKIEEDEEDYIRESSKIKNCLKDILDDIINNINLDKNLIESCSSSILLFLEKDSDDNEENENSKEKEKNIDINYQLELTRSDSNISNLSNLSFIDVINSYNDDKKLEDSDDTNSNTVKYNFEKMSPIIQGEISINEELNIFDDKKVDKILFSENNDNFDYLNFLNHKRNEKI